MGKESNQVEFIQLPDIVLELILSNLAYDEIAKNRIVCRRLNNVCKKLLNRGFYLLEKTHGREFNLIKSQLPRRESEKKNHPLIRHYDILSSMETRISLLFLTFTKYIDANLCCFIPGKILDETFRLLKLVKSPKLTGKNHELLREFRDLSNMAMEHFEEKISPAFERNTFKFLVPDEKSLERSNVFQQYSSAFSENDDREVETSSSNCSENIGKQLNKIYNRLKKNNRGVYRVKGQMSEINRKMNAKFSKHCAQIKQQDTKIQEYANKIKTQDEQLADMKERLEDLNQKLKDLIVASSSSSKKVPNLDSMQVEM